MPLSLPPRHPPGKQLVTPDRRGRIERMPATPTPPPGPNFAATLKPCPDCGREVSRRALLCPHCGAPARVATFHATDFGTVACFLGVAIAVLSLAAATVEPSLTAIAWLIFGGLLVLAGLSPKYVDFDGKG